MIGNSNGIGIGTDNPTEKLDVRGHLKIDNGPVLENHGTGDGLRVTTPTGYCSIGSNNTSFAHFYTDRDKFFFNKKVIVDQGIFSAYNEDLHLATDAAGSDIRLTILNSNGNIGIGTDNPGQNLTVNGSIESLCQVAVGSTDEGGEFIMRAAPQQLTGTKHRYLVGHLLWNWFRMVGPVMILLVG